MKQAISIYSAPVLKFFLILNQDFLEFSSQPRHPLSVHRIRISSLIFLQRASYFGVNIIILCFFYPIFRSSLENWVLMLLVSDIKESV